MKQERNEMDSARKSMRYSCMKSCMLMLVSKFGSMFEFSVFNLRVI